MESLFKKNMIIMLHSNKKKVIKIKFKKTMINLKKIEIVGINS